MDKTFVQLQTKFNSCLLPQDHNRHPEMPKKPLSMYMLYYSERREDIQKEHPHLSMPDVAKICSDEYQKLPEKKKAKYKARCDDMRKEYDERLESFYSSFPAMRPIKTEKAAKSMANRGNMVRFIIYQQLCLNNPTRIIRMNSI